MGFAQAPLGRRPLARYGWRVWGNTGSLFVTPAALLFGAPRILREEIDEIDNACNRFRPDSELSALNRTGGWPVRVSTSLLEALAVAGRAWERSGGAVDPTVGGALCRLGYDRDFDELARTGHPATLGPLGPVPGWDTVMVDAGRHTVCLPADVSLDLGATAKALCADRAAARIAAERSCGVVVALGGDVAVGGPPPPEGWQIALTDDARHATGHPSVPVVTLWRGGMATSGTTARSWDVGGVRMHHIVDPRTGLPADPHWRSVTVAAATRVEANTFATASVVWGDEAVFRVAQARLAALMMPSSGGEPVAVGAWPCDDVVAP